LRLEVAFEHGSGRVGCVELRQRRCEEEIFHVAKVRKKNVSSTLCRIILPISIGAQM
jgi:hypothetical protein